MQVFVEQNTPRIIGVRFAGRLGYEQWRSALDEVAKHLAPPPRKSAVLIDGEGFAGFEPGKWDDMSFHFKHDDDVARMAIVGQPEWKDRILMFTGQGLRPVEIRYFTPDQRQQARTWAASFEQPRAGES